MPISKTRLKIEWRKAGSWLVWLGLLLVTMPVLAQTHSVSHQMSVDVGGDSGEIHVHDRITFAQPVRQFAFLLNAGVKPQPPTSVVSTAEQDAGSMLVRHLWTFAEPHSSVQLSYQGSLMLNAGRGMGGMPSGYLNAQGVYLDGASAWYPMVLSAKQRSVISTADVTVRVPEGWQSLSIGKRIVVADGVRWSAQVPHDDLYLLAGPFTRHVQDHDGIDLSVWLLQDDQALAQRYLSIMGDYIDHYSRLLGDYPFGKFAVIENRWQTGYGMPSFTLLGSRVLRLPFIPYTSLPHEIAHNWLGNGIWVDYQAGNWSEGLTAYLADHWMKERRGKGAAYRLKALQRYSNYAASGKDMPLRDFVSRHDEASQAVGYSKSMMLFHMLRQYMGDQAFVQALQSSWQEQQFKSVGFAAFLDVFLQQRQDLLPIAQQWLNRKGAPRLGLRDVVAEQIDGQWYLQFVLKQDAIQPWYLQVPVAVTLEGQRVAQIQHVDLSSPNQTVRIPLKGKPLRLDVDPEYDVMRLLDTAEQPPALNQLFGGETWLVYPATAPKAVRHAWKRLYESWKKRYPALRLRSDSETSMDDRPQLLLGWDNRQLPVEQAVLNTTEHALKDTGLSMGGTVYSKDKHSIVLVGTDKAGRSVGFVGAQSVEEIGRLARKLVHYGSFGRLVFNRAEGRNLSKDTLRSPNSPLTHVFVEHPVPLRLSRGKALDAG